MAQSITPAIWKSNVVLAPIYNTEKAINAGLNIQLMVHGQLSGAMPVLWLKFPAAFYGQEKSFSQLIKTLLAAAHYD